MSIESNLKTTVLEKLKTTTLKFDSEDICLKELGEDTLKEKFIEQFIEHLFTLRSSNVWSTSLNANLLLSKVLELHELQSLLQETKNKDNSIPLFTPDFGKDI